MTVKQLDRLISKMELDSVRKGMLRGVRKAVMTGRSGDAEVGRASWSVEVQSINGTPMRVSFRFKRDE
jgi:hypothetical protein